MNLEMVLYIEVNCIGIVMISMMMFFILKKYAVYEENSLKHFLWMLASNGLVLLMDIGIRLTRGNTSFTAITLTHLFCVLFFLLQSVFGYAWARYCIAILYPDSSIGKLKKLLLALPAIINAVISISSPWTGWQYYLEESNQYVRGPFMYMSLMILYSYWVFCMAVLIKRKPDICSKRDAFFYYALVIFPLPTLIGNILQIVFYGTTIGWICTIFSLMLIFLNLQNSYSTLDGLTGLYNRRHALADLRREMEHMRGNKLLYVIMMDVDGFKNINDQFGHLNGDKALIDISKIMIKTFSSQDSISRYGGDEFLVSGRAASAEDIENIISNLNEAIRTFNKEKNRPYTLSISSGYATVEKNESITIKEIITRADKAMYKIKQNKKN